MSNPVAAQNNGLNPYSNGMKIERMNNLNKSFTGTGLNPYSNGMKIERNNHVETDHFASSS